MSHPKGKKMNSEKTMTLRAKHGTILRKPKIKKKMDKRGTGLTDGPRRV